MIGTPRVFVECSICKMHTDINLHNADEPNLHLEYYIPVIDEVDGWTITEIHGVWIVKCPVHANVVETVDTPALSPGA